METVLRHQCESLLDRGHEVTALVAGTEAGDRYERLGPTATGAVGRLIRAGALAVCNSQPLTPSLPLLLRRELKLHSPDIVHLHLPNPGACGAWLAIQIGLSDAAGASCLAVWYHADITRQRLGRILVGPLVRSCLARATGISVSSAALRDHSDILAPWRQKVAVIPFGIAAQEWENIDSTADGPFLFVGRLVYYKGLFTLLAAVARVPGAELVIVGDGPLRHALGRQIHREGLATRVRLVGELSTSALRDTMSKVRALVLPSSEESETFGLVQLEAMAAGLPVVSTELPTGVAEVTEDGVTGRIVPPEDLDALTMALAQLQKDTKLAKSWGEAGRQRVRNLFRREGMAAKLESWYAALLDRDTAAVGPDAADH